MDICTAGAATTQDCCRWTFRNWTLSLLTTTNARRRCHPPIRWQKPMYAPTPPEKPTDPATETVAAPWSRNPAVEEPSWLASSPGDTHPVCPQPILPYTHQCLRFCLGSMRTVRRNRQKPILLYNHLINEHSVLKQWHIGVVDIFSKKYLITQLSKLNWLVLKTFLGKKNTLNKPKKSFDLLQTNWK